MKKKEKIVFSTLFIILIIALFISSYKLYQAQKEYKEHKAQQQKVEQEIKARNVRAAKLLIKQLETKNINNIPLGLPALIGEGKSKYVDNNIYSWKFIVDDDSLYSYIVKPINDAIGKEKYNKENSTLCIEIVRDKHHWYVFSIKVDLNKFTTVDDFYTNFDHDIVLDKEIMDNAGIVLW